MNNNEDNNQLSYIQMQLNEVKSELARHKAWFYLLIGICCGNSGIAILKLIGG